MSARDLFDDAAVAMRLAHEPDDDGIAWVEYRPGNAFALCWPWDGTYF